MSLIGPYLVGCALLAIGGVIKVARPGPAANAVGRLLRPSRPEMSTWPVRIAAGLELALGVAGAWRPSWILASAVSGCYIAFAAFVIYARVTGGFLATCACFSSVDARPTRMHVVIDLALAGCAASVASAGSHASLATLFSRQPLSGVPLLGECALCTWLVLITLVTLPRLAEARLPVERRLEAS